MINVILDKAINFDLPPEIEISVFACEQCIYLCTSEDQLKQHKKFHEYHNSNKCPHCDYRCAQAITMRAHIRSHESSVSYECAECPYRTTKKTSYREHLRRHTGDKRFKCQLCDYKSVQKGALTNHIRRHYGEKPQACPHCNYNKPQNCKLYSKKRDGTASSGTHTKRHLEKKPYKCSHCNYSCLEKKNLDRHFKQHTGERPIFCFVCDYRCIQFRSLVEHYKKHKSTRITCAFCGFQTVHSDVLVNHIKDSHKGAWNNKGNSCPLCHGRFSSKEALDTHMKQHSESFAKDSGNAVIEKVSIGSFCDFNTISEEQIRTHEFDHTNKVDPHLLNYMM
ncbi:RE1-silencing transcription factor B [Armadillidium vulgare]|nr:RE1-silencing transcription factor B [Armadillidium vulgare]